MVHRRHVDSFYIIIMFYLIYVHIIKQYSMCQFLLELYNNVGRKILRYV